MLQFGSLLLLATALASEPDPRVAAGSQDCLAPLAAKVRPGFLLGSFSSGLHFDRPQFAARAEFFRRNFNIMTVGVYMNGIQRAPGDIDFRQVDALVGFAAEHSLKVHLHPLVGGAEYTPKWVTEGGFSKDALLDLMRRRITAILKRHPGRIDFVDVVNEALTDTGRKADGSFRWQEKAWKGGDHVWFKALGMWQGQRHQFPLYLVEAFREARTAAGPDVRLILNEWGNETTKSLRGRAFLDLVQALRAEGIPVDAAGLQLHSRIKDGVFCDWLGKPFDYDAFDAMLLLYEQAGIDVHITEFDVHLPPQPTEKDFELQGTHYARVLRYALRSAAVKSFKTWGFTDAVSWKADGVDGYPLLLDGNLEPKAAYQRQVEMLRSWAGSDP
jgi:endo-1,4-beta-xylanase